MCSCWRGGHRWINLTVIRTFKLRIDQLFSINKNGNRNLLCNLNHPPLIVGGVRFYHSAKMAPMAIMRRSEVMDCADMIELELLIIASAESFVESPSLSVAFLITEFDEWLEAALLESTSGS